jgi:hypothetical protein
LRMRNAAPHEQNGNETQHPSHGWSPLSGESRSSMW